MGTGYQPNPDDGRHNRSTNPSAAALIVGGVAVNGRHGHAVDAYRVDTSVRSDKVKEIQVVDSAGTDEVVRHRGVLAGIAEAERRQCGEVGPPYPDAGFGGGPQSDCLLPRKSGRDWGPIVEHENSLSIQDRSSHRLPQR